MKLQNVFFSLKRCNSIGRIPAWHFLTDGINKTVCGRCQFLKPLKYKHVNTRETEAYYYGITILYFIIIISLFFIRLCNDAFNKSLTMVISALKLWI